MPSYPVETFLPRGAAGERNAHERRARSAAEELTRQGLHVRFEQTIHVPDDEICFFSLRCTVGTGGRAGSAASGTPSPPRREAVSSGKE